MALKRASARANTTTEGTMKTLSAATLGAILLTAIASPSQADNLVIWRTIIGVAQANNVVGGITAGGQPWSTREGAFDGPNH